MDRASRAEVDFLSYRCIPEQCIHDGEDFSRCYNAHFAHGTMKDTGHQQYCHEHTKEQTPTAACRAPLAVAQAPNLKARWKAENSLLITHHCIKKCLHQQGYTWRGAYCISSQNATLMNAADRSWTSPSHYLAIIAGSCPDILHVHCTWQYFHHNCEAVWMALWIHLEWNPK